MHIKLTSTISRSIIIIIIMMTLTSCMEARSKLNTIRKNGVIHFVTTYSPSTYYIDSDNEAGFEYELAKLFSDQLDVGLKIIVAKNKSEVIKFLKTGKADIAAGLLKQSIFNDGSLLLGPEYMSVYQQVVYRNGIDRPRTLNDLHPFQLHLTEGSTRPDSLVEYKSESADFNWKIHKDKSNSDLLDLIETKKITYAVVYSNELSMAQQTKPELRAAFEMSEPGPLTWIINKINSESLLVEIEKFFGSINKNNQLAELIDHYYGPIKKFDYVDQYKFIEQFSIRFPNYEAFFKQAGEIYGFDWRLLAAVSYQESHWNERAHSPTGVRGMMMLTLDTAKHMKVSNRLDPKQSIFGGAKYIKQLIEKIPERIQEPDRTWLALAAYNVGFGHLEDARIITEKQGRNPDKWQKVKMSLPLLTQQEWYKQTANGYARGNEPVKYVENIRKYYSTLIQLTKSESYPKEPIEIIDLNPWIIL